MWQSIKTFFKDSETIFWARLQTLIGLVLALLDVLAQINGLIDPALLQPLLTPSWFSAFMLINGLLTEYLRKRRANDL